MTETRRKIPHPLPDNTLCRVCSAVASGVHFGVITCESCKLFFLRISRSTAAAAEPQACKRDGACPIREQTRSACRACRFACCLRAGMAKGRSFQGRNARLKFNRHLSSQKESSQNCASVPEDEQSVDDASLRGSAEDENSGERPCERELQNDPGGNRNDGHSLVTAERSQTLSETLEPPPLTVGLNDSCVSFDSPEDPLIYDRWELADRTNARPPKQSCFRVHMSTISRLRCFCRLNTNTLGEAESFDPERFLPKCEPEDPLLFLEYDYSRVYNGLTLDHYLALLPPDLSARLANMSDLFHTWFNQRSEMTRSILESGDVESAFSMAFQQYALDFTTNYFQRSIFMKPFRDLKCLDNSDLIPSALSGYMIAMSLPTLNVWFRRRPVLRDKHWMYSAKVIYPIFRELQLLQLSKTELLLVTALFCFKTLRCYFSHIASAQLLEEEINLKRLTAIVLHSSKRTAILKSLNDIFETHINWGFSRFRSLLSAAVSI